MVEEDNEPLISRLTTSTRRPISAEKKPILKWMAMLFVAYVGMFAVFKAFVPRDSTENTETVREDLTSHRPMAHLHTAPRSYSKGASRIRLLIDDNWLFQLGETPKVRTLSRQIKSPNILTVVGGRSTVPIQTSPSASTTPNANTLATRPSRTL